MYIPFKSAHPRHTIKNYIVGELKRHVRINTEELNFLKIKNKFFQRMRNRGFKKNKLSHWFSEVKYSYRAKYLGVNLGNICYLQGTSETQADSLLTKVSEEIFEETMSRNTRDTTEVVSEDEGAMVSMEDIVYQEGSFSKGSSKKRQSHSILLKSKKKQNKLCLSNCSSSPVSGQRKNVLYVSRITPGKEKFY